MNTLYIISDSRSGSTLLQHLLALQRGIVALGEVRRLEQMVRDGEACACGRRVDQCSFWRRVASHSGLSLDQIRTIPATQVSRRRFGEVLGWTALKFGLEPPVRKLLAREQRAAANCLAIYHAARQLTENRIVVDASKAPSQFLHLYLEGKELVQPVFLVRDGRAVMWSKMQRVGISAERAARQWLRVSRMMLALRRVVPNMASNVVHYEELCREPSGTLQRILSRVDATVRSTDLKDLPNERHDLGGSPRFRRESPDEINLDERWRTEMPKKHLATFERIAGPMNRRLGYV